MTDHDGRRHAEIVHPKTRNQRQLVEMLSARSWQLLKGEVDYSDELARCLFNDMDTDNSGELDLLEFKKLMRIVSMRKGEGAVHSRSFNKAIRRDFEVVDFNNDRRIDEEEFVAYLRLLLTQDEAEEAEATAPVPAATNTKEEQEKMDFIALSKNQVVMPKAGSLQEAILSGVWTWVNAYLNMGETACRGGTPPIVVAAKHEKLNIAKNLVAIKNLDPSLMDSERKAIALACDNASADELKRIVRDLYTHAYDRYEMLESLESDDLEAARKKMKNLYYQHWGTGRAVKQEKHGGSVKKGGHQLAKTEQLAIACQNNDITAVRKLLRSKMSPNSKDERDSTPLMHCSWFGHHDVAKLLLEAKGDLMVQNRRKNTAFHFVTEKAHYDMVVLFLRYPGGMSAARVKNCLGYRPWQLAKDTFVRDIAHSATLSHKTKIDDRHSETFRQHKVNATMNSGFLAHLRSDITGAIIEDDIKSVSLLIAKKPGHEDDADHVLSAINDHDHFGLTSMHYACAFSHLDVVKALVDRKADIQSRTKFNNTPLHFAYGADRKSVIRFLLSQDPDGVLPKLVNQDNVLPSYASPSKRK